MKFLSISLIQRMRFLSFSRQRLSCWQILKHPTTEFIIKAISLNEEALKLDAGLEPLKFVNDVQLCGNGNKGE